MTMMVKMVKASLTEHLLHTRYSAQSFLALSDLLLTPTISILAVHMKQRLRER